MLRTHRFAILGVGHKNIVHCFCHGNAHGVLVGIQPFRHDPACLFLDTALIEQSREQHARPFTAARSSVDVLDGLAIRTTYRPIVGIALQKIDPRHGWQTLQLIHRINQRVIHHSMDQQAMLLRIDIRNALNVVHQEMEAGRCDDPIQILKRSR